MAGKSSKNGLNGTAAKTVGGENLQTTLKETVEVTSEQTVTESEPKVKSTRRSRVAEYESTEESVEQEVGFAPKTFLIPYVLLMLRNTFLHGYAIWERLMLMGIPGLNQGDRATIYRTLRQLEREGKVKSVWDTTTEGPARRVYTLTDAGENFLRIWATGLDQYRHSLDFFFNMYTGRAIPNPFNFNFTNGNFGTPDNDPKGGKN